jgi:hypothetical protein
MEYGSTMSHWVLLATQARWLLLIWLGIVLVYGLWRSRGEAKQDPIRPSGPNP